MKSKFTKTKIYVSYARETDKEIGIINDLKRLTRWMRDVELIWDEKNLNPGDSIRKFISSMSVGDKVVVVISDAYAISPWCMTELQEINKPSNDFSKSIFPIVVGGCELLNWRGSQEYQTQLKEKLRETKTKGIEKIIESLDDVLRFFSGLSYISYDELKKGKYKKLKEFIQPCELPIWVQFVGAVLGVLIIFLGFWSFDSNQQLKKTEGKNEELQNKEQQRLKEDIERRLSLGEEYFLEAYFDKRVAAKELLQKGKMDLDWAKGGFEKSLKELPDDPEARIYFENINAMQLSLSKTKNENQIRTIAVSVPIQKNVTVAKEILRGVAQAQKEINEAWLTECKSEGDKEKCAKRGLLRVLIASDDNDPNIAKGIAKYIANERKDILAVVGHNSSEVSNKVMEEYQGKIVMLSPTSYTLNHSANKTLARARDDNYIYSMTPKLESILPVILDYIRSLESEQEERNIYFCGDSKAHDTARFIDGLSNKINLKGFSENTDKNYPNKYNIDCDLAELKKSNDFLKKEKENKKLTDLFLSVHVSTIIDAVILAKRAYKELHLYNAYTLFNRDILRREFNELVVVVGWHSMFLHHNNENQEFIKNARCVWNGHNERAECSAGKFDPDIDLTWRSAMAYDTTKLISKGLDKILLEVTGDVARRELQKQIPNLKPDGVTGKIEFKENGEREGGQGHLVKVVEVTIDKAKEGKTAVDCEYVFVPLKKQQNGRYELPLIPSKEKYRFLKKNEECKDS